MERLTFSLLLVVLIIMTTGYWTRLGPTHGLLFGQSIPALCFVFFIRAFQATLVDDGDSDDDLTEAILLCLVLSTIILAGLAFIDPVSPVIKLVGAADLALCLIAAAAYGLIQFLQSSVYELMEEED